MGVGGRGGWQGLVHIYIYMIIMICNVRKWNFEMRFEYVWLIMMMYYIYMIVYHA